MAPKTSKTLLEVLAKTGPVPYTLQNDTKPEKHSPEQVMTNILGTKRVTIENYTRLIQQADAHGQMPEENIDRLLAAALRRGDGALLAALVEHKGLGIVTADTKKRVNHAQKTSPWRYGQLTRSFCYWATKPVKAEAAEGEGSVRWETLTRNYDGETVQAQTRCWPDGLKTGLMGACVTQEQYDGLIHGMQGTDLYVCLNRAFEASSVIRTPLAKACNTLEKLPRKYTAAWGHVHKDVIEAQIGPGGEPANGKSWYIETEAALVMIDHCQTFNNLMNLIDAGPRNVEKQLIDCYDKLAAQEATKQEQEGLPKEQMTKNPVTGDLQLHHSGALVQLCEYVFRSGNTQETTRLLDYTKELQNNTLVTTYEYLLESSTFKNMDSDGAVQALDVLMEPLGDTARSYVDNHGRARLRLVRTWLTGGYPRQPDEETLEKLTKKRGVGWVENLARATKSIRGYGNTDTLWQDLNHSSTGTLVAGQCGNVFVQDVFGNAKSKRELLHKLFQHHFKDNVDCWTSAAGLVLAWEGTLNDLCLTVKAMNG